MLKKHLQSEKPEQQENSGHETEPKYPCFLEIPPKDRRKEKFCIQINQNSLFINNFYRLIKKVKNECYCELLNFSHLFH